MDTNTKDKVYEPEVIVENPFPGEDSTIPITQTQSPGVFTATTTKPTFVPKKKIAYELLSTALNTRSRKILQEFELQQSGGFQIGTFENGISGDLKITPNGITARDISGISTFAIDGTTGDATFRGQVQAADFTVIDENGLVSLSAFDNESITLTNTENIVLSTISGNQNMTDMVLTIPDYGRDVNVLILLTLKHTVSTTSPSGTLEQVTFFLTIDGSGIGATSISTVWDTDNSGFTDNSTIHSMRQVGSGEHTLRVMYSYGGGVPVGTLSLYSRTLSFLVLGR